MIWWGIVREEVIGNNEIKEKKQVIKWNHAVYYWNKIS